MSQDPEVDFKALGVTGAGAQGGGQSPLEPGDGAFGLSSLAVGSAVEAAVHLSSVSGLGPPSPAASVQADDGAADAQMLACHGVVAFGVVAAVGQNAVDPHSLQSAAEDRLKERGVLAGAVGHDGVNQQVRGVVEGEGRLGPASQAVAVLADPMGIVSGAVPGLQPGGIDARLLLVADHALFPRVREDRVEERVESTFLRRRACALWSVV